MNKFSDYIKEDHGSKVISEEKTSEINDLIDKYSKYTQSDLMNEFINESVKKKKQGTLKQADLERMKLTLAPYN